MAQLGRKCRLDWQFAHAYCVCSVDPFLCLCAWVKVYPELDHSRKFGGFTPESWTAQLRKLLAELGVQEANKYFGHDLRRGSALDVFSERRVAAMLQHGRWKSLGGAAPYVSLDEVQAGCWAQGMANDSEPES